MRQLKSDHPLSYNHTNVGLRAYVLKAVKKKNGVMLGYYCDLRQSTVDETFSDIAFRMRCVQSWKCRIVVVAPGRSTYLRKGLHMAFPTCLEPHLLSGPSVFAPLCRMTEFAPRLRKLLCSDTQWWIGSGLLDIEDTKIARRHKP